MNENVWSLQSFVSFDILWQKMIQNVIVCYITKIVTVSKFVKKKTRKVVWRHQKWTFHSFLIETLKIVSYVRYFSNRLHLFTHVDCFITTKGIVYTSIKSQLIQSFIHENIYFNICTLFFYVCDPFTFFHFPSFSAKYFFKSDYYLMKKIYITNVCMSVAFCTNLIKNQQLLKII